MRHYSYLILLVEILILAHPTACMEIAYAIGPNGEKPVGQANISEYNGTTTRLVNWMISAQFSPAGTKVVTAGYDNTSRIWDVSSGRELFKLPHEGLVNSAQFSPDGTKVVTASDDYTSRIWDVSSGRELFKLPHKDWVYSAQFSPDGTKVVTASDDKTARIWDVKSGQELAKLPHEGWVVYSAKFSPDGTKVVTASDDYTSRIWNASTGQELSKLPHEGLVNSAQFSPDGTKVVTSSSVGTAQIWDVQTGKELHRLYHDSAVWTVAFSPDGERIASASNDKTARIWDIVTGKELLAINHDNGVSDVAFNPNGSNIVTATFDGIVTIWDAADGKRIRILGNLPPTANFTYLPLLPNVGDQITFDASQSLDQDGKILDYAWSFGDGSTDEGVFAKHQYSSGGAFIANLTVTDDQGARNQTSIKIKINEPPKAVYSVSPLYPIKAGDTVIFNASESYDPDGIIVGYSWNFGDGDYAIRPIVSHIFNSSGNFTVALEVIDNQGAKAKTFSQLVVSGPQDLPIIRSFSAHPADIPFRDTTILEWKTSNAVSVTLMPAMGVVKFNGSVAVSPANTTSYRLTATNKNGSKEAFVQVYVHPRQAIAPTEPPVAVASYYPKEPKVRELITFDASQSGSRTGNITRYLWSLGDGYSVSSNISFLKHQYLKGGNYRVNLTVTDDNGLDNNTSISIMVSEPPIPIIELSPSILTVGDNISFNASKSYDPDGIIVDYSWTFGDGYSSKGNQSNHRYQSSGTYNITLDVIDDRGLINQTSIMIKIYEPLMPTIQFSPRSPLLGEIVAFNASQSRDPNGTIISYLWNFGDGHNSSGISVNHQYQRGGIYNVTLAVMDNRGFKNQTQATLIIPDNVNAIVFSPDDKRIATASGNKAIIWDAQTGKALLYINHTSAVNDVAFSPKGDKIATASDDGLGKIWNATIGHGRVAEELLNFTHLNRVDAITFSADGKWIATASDDKTARIWNATSGEEILRLNHKAGVEKVIFSSDNKKIATTSGGTVIIWNATTGKELLDLNNADLITTVFFDPNNKWIATVSSAGIERILNATTGEEQANLKLNESVNSAAFALDGKKLVLAPLNASQTTRIFDSMTGKLLLDLNYSLAKAVAISSDGKQAASASANGTVRIWNSNAVSYLELKVPVASAPKYFVASRSTVNSESANLFYGSEDGGWEGSNQLNDESSVWDREDDEILKKYCRGIISFKPRIPMVVNITNEVKACIAKNNTSGFMALINDQELDKELQIKGIKITRNMTLRLDDPANIFRIERETLASQRILKDAPTCWRWKVTPMKNGTYELVLVAIADLTKNGAPIAPREEEVLREKIIIIANENETSKQNPINNAKKIANEIYLGIAALITLLGSLFYVLNEYRKLKKGDSK